MTRDETAPKTIHVVLNLYIEFTIASSNDVMMKVDDRAIVITNHKDNFRNSGDTGTTRPISVCKSFATVV